MNKYFTILVVDDSLTQLTVLQDTLEEKGFAVETATNGIEAITRVYHSPPNLILSDVLMPELNGYHLCRLLKNDPNTAHIPIILLTNLKERHDRFWGEKAGADLYLEKGADLAPILEAVKSLLPESSSQNLCIIPPPSEEFSRVNIQERITGTLDRLLYESTISNEILKLTGLAHDIDLLAREFLSFLSVISRYSVAGLLLREGRDKYVLSIQIAEPISNTSIERARKEILQKTGPSLGDRAQLRFLLLQDEYGQEALEQFNFQSFQHLPIIDEGEFLGSVTLFNEGERHLTEGTRHALNVVADRFLFVARYLKKIKEIEDVKADFISMLVHDLRAPLTGISGFTDVLAEGILGSVTEEQGAALKNIQSGCSQLLHLIEDILEFSKLEAGKMQIHPAPLQIRPLAEQVFADLSALFMEKELDARVEIPEDTPYVSADAKQLVRVLTNLLTNAVKFTPPGGKITLSVGKTPVCPASNPENCLQLNVSDTGVGIPAEQQKKLFDRYHQLPSASMFRKGTGLGLAICKEIISLHGGEIWVESPIDESGGSRFSFTLPLAT
jgi:signal transduction histidine kinase/CheY-like chemotaxis protein